MAPHWDPNDEPVEPKRRPIDPFEKDRGQGGPPAGGDPGPGDDRRDPRDNPRSGRGDGGYPGHGDRSDSGWGVMDGLEAEPEDGEGELAAAGRAASRDDEVSSDRWVEPT